MEIIYINKTLKEIQADLEIVLLKESKYLKVNDMFLKGKKLYIKIPNYKFYTITEIITNVIKHINKVNKYKSIKIALYGITNKKIQALIDGLLLGSYDFVRYKNKKIRMNLKEIFIANENYQEIKFSYEEIKSKIDNYIIINKNINLAREIINSVAEDTTPEKISIWIKEELKNTNIECLIKDNDYIRTELPAFYDISKGSINQPNLVHLKYNENKGLKKFVLIGKGVTFDTGGISLKPSEYMYDMKLDKAGAITIFGIIRSITELRLPIEIHAILGFSENMISNNAYKPGDVIKTRNSKTIEIMNTDAEGRLTLVDAVHYIINNEKASNVIDVATLTGAALVALGTTTTAALSNNDDFYNKIDAAAKLSDERIWRLPNFPEYGKLIESKIADLKNTGGRYAGTITAGMFIEKFVGETPWIHLDIAGSSWADAPYDFYTLGGTGQMVKTLFNFVKNY